MLSAAPLSAIIFTALSTIVFFWAIRVLAALFAPDSKTTLLTYLTAALKVYLAAVTCGVTSVDVPNDNTKAAAYFAPERVSKEISAMPATQVEASAEQPM